MVSTLILCGVLMTQQANEDAKPSAAQVQLLKTFRSEFLPITPGKGKFPKSFRMGRAKGGRDNEGPVRKVTFGYTFQIAKYEVPQDLWEVVMGNNPSRWKGPRNSVEELSFADAQLFCRKATKLMRSAKLINKDESIRLPSEAEWEYVARAGTSTVYSFGDDTKSLAAFGWFHGNAAGNDPPVGAKKANPWGLYDVHGYLWEWCTDVAHQNYKDAPANGAAWTKGGTAGKRVLRGGSWKDNAELCTSSYRRLDSAKLKDDAVGLRCVLVKSAK